MIEKETNKNTPPKHSHLEALYHFIRILNFEHQIEKQLCSFIYDEKLAVLSGIKLLEYRIKGMSFIRKIIREEYKIIFSSYSSKELFQISQKISKFSTLISKKNISNITHIHTNKILHKLITRYSNYVLYSKKLEKRVLILENRTNPNYEISQEFLVERMEFCMMDEKVIDLFRARYHCKSE